MATGIPAAVWEQDPRAMATAIELLEEAHAQRTETEV